LINLLKGKVYVNEKKALQRQTKNTRLYYTFMYLFKELYIYMLNSK